MGYNDKFDPSTYDANDPDSMRALADRAMRQSKPTAAPMSTEKFGECWDCGKEGRLYGPGLCSTCYVATKC